jgi:hypothetical protein
MAVQVAMVEWVEQEAKVGPVGLLAVRAGWGLEPGWCCTRLPTDQAMR